ncbi:polysaccharide pyruvyl transferase family protein [Speluncibacter jeojiensis]|uniref:Polysaccharide pyruvyl transferase family protein n=1 Tax=Speluncibacter jeojiensis TaxID=2710754 RepID=A0A9X4REA8_9ACTN|nr:polysaccharide pyruvyl transferase family protein [Corynebacteriales bacterium D3-21]
MSTPAPLADLVMQSRDLLSDVMGAAPTVALLDFPAYTNAGDSMIYLGEMAYLDALDRQVGYACSIRDYDRGALRARVPEGPILLQGGGNFGELWPHHQQFREQVIADFPDRPIVQLPQTMDFQPGAALERTRELYARHRDLTLLLRDRAGAERAAEWFPHQRVEFCPDLALGLGPLAPTRTPTHDVVLLKRTDKESVNDAAALNCGNHTVTQSDWELTGDTESRWNRLEALGGLLSLNRFTRRRTVGIHQRLYDQQANINLAAAIHNLSQGRIVVTDRLHAAVLAALLGKPVVATDNVSKKVSNIFRDYLGALPGCYFAEDLAEAGQIARTLLAPSGVPLPL